MAKLSEPVETIHLRFVYKFDKLEEFCNLTESYPLTRPLHEKLFELLDETMQDYYANTADILHEYYNNEGQAPSNTTETFLDVIRVHAIDGRIASCVIFCSKIMAALDDGSLNISVQQCYNQLQAENTNVDITSVKYEICCGKKMIIVADGSHLYCETCNREFEIKGMILDDIQFHSPSNKKGRSNTYDRKRNFRTWLECILCLEDLKVSSEHDSRIRQCIRRDDYGEPGKARRLTLDTIREYFKELKITTQYNKHAAWFLSKYSGVAPPQFRTSEIDEVVAMFVKIDNIIHQRNNPLTEEMHNTPYCPYLIRRIVEYKWPDDPDKMRIRYFIYLKEPSTIIKLDMLWSCICECLRPQYDIKYTPMRFYESQQMW